MRKDKAAEHEAFIEGVLAEAERAPDIGAVDTVYFGGGTPSALRPDELSRLLKGLRQRLCIAPDAPLHFEANPEDISEDSLAAWRELGVRFLSIGLQSFDDPSLRFLGRRHDGDEARRAVDAAVASGIDVISIDLIFGLDARDAEIFAKDIEIVGASGARHVSGYQLTIHDETPFARRRDQGQLREMPQDEQGRRYALAHQMLAAAGFRAYEVSNFARDEAARSRHNLKYWRHAPYLGLGPSAHSFDGQRRHWNHRALDDWSQALGSGASPVAGAERLDANDLLLEGLMLGLRCATGFDSALLGKGAARFLEVNRKRLEAWEADGLIVVEGGVVKPMPRGFAVADALAAELDLPK